MTYFIIGGPPFLASGEVFAGYDGITLKLFIHGNTRDNIYFVVDGAAGEQFLVRGDGQTFNLKDYIDGMERNGGVTNAYPALTTRDVLYSVDGDNTASPETPRVVHVTNIKAQTPPLPDAPEVKDYLGAAPATTGTLARVPERSVLMRFQEFEEWNA